MSDISATIDVKMDGSLLEENSSLKMLGLSFTINLDWVSCIISIIGALIFLSLEVAHYLNTVFISGLILPAAT